MIFKRTSVFSSPHSVEQIKKNLMGNHIALHHLDFEIMDKDHMLKIIPHAENVDNVKTLPITHVTFSPNGAGTKIKMSSHMRRIDAGGPILLTVFCLIAMLGGIALFFMKNIEWFIPLVLFALGFIIFIIFWLRMESGYFDYIRKIKKYVKTHS